MQIYIKEINGTTYKILADSEATISNGTYFHIDTHDEAIRILNILCDDKERVQIELKYSDGYVSSFEDFGNTGHVGRTTGLHAPILVFNSRSYGGGLISTQFINRIRTSKGKRIFYLKS